MSDAIESELRSVGFVFAFPRQSPLKTSALPRLTCQTARLDLSRTRSHGSAQSMTSVTQQHSCPSESGNSLGGRCVPIYHEPYDGGASSALASGCGAPGHSWFCKICRRPWQRSLLFVANLFLSGVNVRLEILCVVRLELVVLVLAPFPGQPDIFLEARLSALIGFRDLGARQFQVK